MKFPIVLQSPARLGFVFFRRIHADGRCEKKLRGMDWEPGDPPTLQIPLENYLHHLVRRVGWKIVEGGQ